MCWCNPNIRTPNCGKIDCVPKIENYKPEDLIKNEYVKKLVEALKFYADEDRIFLTHGKTLQETLEVTDMQDVAREALKDWQDLDEK